MGQDMTRYIAIRCILRYIVIFHRVHRKCHRADNQVVVCDLGSLNTSHYIDNSVDKLSQNNVIQNFLSNLFEQYWQNTKHTDVAAITSTREIKFKGTSLKLDTLR